VGSRSDLTRYRRALAALLLALCALGCTGGPDPDRDADRVVLIGLDGLDWKVLEPLLASGAMPNLARFIARGAAGELATLPLAIAPTYSPIIWASVATGKLPAKHGITGFGRAPDGRVEHMIPYTSNSRRARALWNILGDGGGSVAVIGWWTTWPAERVDGVMVSDRLAYTRMNLWFGLARSGEELPAQTHPPELIDELAGLAADSERLLADFFSRFRPGERPQALDESLHDPWYELLLAYARDETYRRIAERIQRERSYQLFAFYLNGTDIASHYFWKYRFPEQWAHAIPEGELRERRDVVDRYYAYVDEAIGPWLEQAGERCLVIVVSDHGFVTGARSDSPNISGTHYLAAPPGVIAMAGGAVPPGVRLSEAGVLDVAPTILHALGRPVGRDMDGRVLLAGGADASARPVVYVETHEGAPPERDHAPIASERDDEIIARLRALGYLDSPGAVD
jgi:arylsulfatase A-like enzyme